MERRMFSFCLEAGGCCCCRKKVLLLPAACLSTAMLQSPDPVPVPPSGMHNACTRQVEVSVMRRGRYLACMVVEGRRKMQKEKDECQEA